MGRDKDRTHRGVGGIPGMPGYEGGAQREEIRRGPNVKEYDQEKRSFMFRTLLVLLPVAFMIVYATAIYARYYGLLDIIPSSATEAETSASFRTFKAYTAVLFAVWIIKFALIYRTDANRVSKKTGSNPAR